jgi:hypothetical protein
LPPQAKFKCFITPFRSPESLKSCCLQIFSQNNSRLFTLTIIIIIGETIEHIIPSCTVLAQSKYKKRHDHDIFARIIHINLVVKFNLLKNTQPHYTYTPESCLENDNYKLYFPVLPTKRATRGRKRAKRVKWKSSKGIEKIREISEASKQEISEAR